MPWCVAARAHADATGLFLHDLETEHVGHELHGGVRLADEETHAMNAANRRIGPDTGAGPRRALIAFARRQLELQAGRLFEADRFLTERGWFDVREHAVR